MGIFGILLEVERAALKVPGMLLLTMFRVMEWCTRCYSGNSECHRKVNWHPVVGE